MNGPTNGGHYSIQVLDLRRLSFTLGFTVQVDLVICRLFVCEFEYFRLLIYHFSGTYHRIYTYSWSVLYVSLMLFWFLSIAYNKVHLYINLSEHIGAIWSEKSLKKYASLLSPPSIFSPKVNTEDEKKVVLFTFVSFLLLILKAQSMKLFFLLETN